MNDQLYQDILLENAERPVGNVLLDEYNVETTLHNYSCGDQLNLRAQIKENKLEEVSCLVDGCLLCTASASILCQQLKGQSTKNCLNCIDLLKRATEDGHLLDTNDEMRILSKINRFPNRIKCVLLPWVAMQRALTRSNR